MRSLQQKIRVALCPPTVCTSCASRITEDYSSSILSFISYREFLNSIVGINPIVMYELDIPPNVTVEYVYIGSNLLSL